MSAPDTLHQTIETAGDIVRETVDDGVARYLREGIDEWCTEHGLDRLENSEAIVGRHVMFNLLLKSALYEHYHRRGVLPPLSADPMTAFGDALDVTGDPAFEEYVLDHICWQLDAEDKERVIQARHRVVAAENPTEMIGSLYESVTPQESRRKLGQFRTPPWIAELMSSWVVTDGSEIVLDAGMGASSLSAAVSQKIHQEHTLHRGRMVGVEKSCLGVVMGQTGLALEGTEVPCQVVDGDFLDIKSRGIEGSVDGIVSNPPYTRHHELPVEYKQRVNAQIETELDREVSALSPMYAYFYYRAGSLLLPGSRASFITPSEFLETTYGESIKQYLLDEFDVSALVLFNQNGESKFDDAMTTSLVSFLEKSEETVDETESVTRFIRVDGDPSEEELFAAVSGDIDGEVEWGFINPVLQGEIDPETKWTEFFNPVSIDTEGLVPLSDIATVNRGIATGKNEYFCLTEADVERWGIETQYLSKIMRNSHSVPTYKYTVDDWEDEQDAGDQVWVLYHLTELDPRLVKRVLSEDTVISTTLTACFDGLEGGEEAQSGVVEYLQYGMKDEKQVHTGYLARNRTPWFVVDRRDPPEIVVTYMSRDGARFIQNSTSARTLSNLHGIYMDVNVSECEEKALLAYLNSDFASVLVKQCGRTYSSGMDKIEPNEMEGVPVLDPRQISEEVVQELAMLFDRLEKVARGEGSGNGGEVCDVVDAIDGVLEDILE